MILKKFLKINKISQKRKDELKLKTSWPGNMKRILNGQKEWSKYWDQDGYFRMFDLATKKNGNIYVHGRNDDVINIGGKKVFPSEIEDLLIKHPDINDCACISLNNKSSITGEQIQAYIVLKRGIEFDKSKYIRFLKGKIEPYKIPSDFVAIKKIPTTESGKKQREKLNV